MTLRRQWSPHADRAFFFFYQMQALAAVALSLPFALAAQADLVLLAIVAWALTGRWQEAMILGVVGGVWLDLLSAVPIGVSSLALVIVAYGVAVTEGRLWGAHLLTPLGVILAASLVFIDRQAVRVAYHVLEGDSGTVLASAHGAEHGGFSSRAQSGGRAARRLRPSSSGRT